MTDHELHAYAAKLVVLAGHAINANNGRCAVIEDALVETTSLCCEVMTFLEATSAELHRQHGPRDPAPEGRSLFDAEGDPTDLL